MQFTEKDYQARARLLEKQIVCLQSVAEKATAKEAQVSLLTSKLELLEADRATKCAELVSLLDQCESMRKQQAEFIRARDETKDLMVDKRVITGFIV